MSVESHYYLARLKQVRSVLKQEIKRTKRKISKQHQELTEAQKYIWYRQIANSLLSINEEIPRGTSKISIVNIHTNTQEEVQLNPKFDVLQNAELLFKKARKGERSVETSTQKVNTTNKHLQGLEELNQEAEALSVEIHTSETEKRLSQLEAVLHVGEGNSQKNGPKTENVPFRHFHIEDWNIYIGKNNTQNDELSIHFARPSDIWLHVVAHAGSHVIIRRPKNTNYPPRPIIEKAASLAVWFSKAKHTSFAEVHFTEARFVRKRRHAPAGEVIAERCKTIRISPKSPQELFPSDYDSPK
jgi:predicted ribosome quality control (RQC) complex YloA/Tae2 family protein